jgi:hypothetical protein
MLRLYWCPICKKFHTEISITREDFYYSYCGYKLDRRGEIQEESLFFSDTRFSYAHISIDCPEGHLIVEFESDIPANNCIEDVEIIEDYLRDYMVEIDDKGRIIHIGEEIEGSEKEVKRMLAEMV